VEANKESIRIQNELRNQEHRSRFRIYSDLIIGKSNIFYLFLYEFIMLFFSWVPGAIGLWLRQLFYPLLLKKCGRKVVFGANVIFRHPLKIEIGDNVVIDDNCLIDAKGISNEGIWIGSNTYIGRNSILSCKNGNIKLGRNVNIGFNCDIFSGSNVEIGDDVLIAAYSYIIGGDHDATKTDRSVSAQGSTSYGIKIGNGTWLGAGVKVLDGRNIGAHCIVGAGAVVTKGIPDYTVAAGVPARVIKDRRLDNFGNEQK